MAPRKYGRQADGKTIKSLSLDERLVVQIERIAEGKGMSFSAYLNEILSKQFLSPSADVSILTFPQIPLLRAAAGVPILADAEHVEPDRDLGPGRFLLELRGDSMEPRFRHKQRVVLRDKASLKRPVLKYGQFYCFIQDGQACFKQWAKDERGNKVLHSLNPEHRDIRADESTDWIGWFDKADNL